MKNFCSKCGTPIDAATGLCPNCDREKIEAIAAQNVQEETPKVFVQKYCDQCGADLDPETRKCSNPECNSRKILGTDGLFSSDKSEKKGEDGTKKKKPTSVTTLITVFLSIVLFFTSVLGVVIYEVRNTLSEDNVEAMLEDIEVSDLLKTVKKSGEGKEVEDFYHNMEVKYGVDMDEDDLNDFINRSNAKEFLADKIADFGEDVFEKNAELVIEKDEIIEFLDDNSRDFEKEFDTELTEKMKKELADNFMSKEELVIIDMGELEDEIPSAYDAVTIGLSYWTMFGFIVLSLLIIFLMYLNGWSQALNGVGITFVTISGITALVAILGVCLSSVWETLVGGAYVGIVIGNFMTINLWPGLILFVLGIGLIVGRVLLKKHIAKKQQAEPVEDAQQ